MVSATPSGGWLWGAPVIPSLGFCLGTRAQMFWLEEGLPNSLEPGKRPRTTLSPTLVARDGEPYLALGTPGGDQQDQWTLHAFLGHVHSGLDLQAAIDAPNHHTEAFPSSFYPRETMPRHVAVEERAGAETIEGCAERGHEVEVSAAWTLGRVSAVARERGRGPEGRERTRAAARDTPQAARGDRSARTDDPARARRIQFEPMDDDYGSKFWLKVAGLFVLGAIGLFVISWLFLSLVYAWSFLGALLVLAVVALAFGWMHDRRNNPPHEGSY